MHRDEEIAYISLRFSIRIDALETKAQNNIKSPATSHLTSSSAEELLPQLLKKEQY